MRLSQRQSSGSPFGESQRLWRVTTASRVFVLAAASGLALGNGGLTTSIVPLVAIVVLAAIMSTVELETRAAMPVLPIAEAALAALILGLSGHLSAAPLVVYLVVPTLIAGLRHGTVSVLNAVAAEATATLGIVLGSQGLDRVPEYLHVSMPWMVVGLGVGLLASWMRSSARALEEAQGPYLAAHRLLTQLRRVSKQLPTGLDARSIADFLVDETRSSLKAGRAAVLIGGSADQTVLIARAGDEFGEGLHQDPALLSTLSDGQFHQRVLPKEPGPLRNRIVFPARVGQRILGAVVVDAATNLPHKSLESAQQHIDEHSLRLDTALLFDEVRALATDEERTRLAREIHDGIAQEIASLGYLVDDLAAGTDPMTTRLAAVALRGELSRVVGELRLSIFDLRHGVTADSDLNTALTEYVRQVEGKHDGLRIHLDLPDEPVRLQRDVETELLRIAQEAVTNVRKHAGAKNLWLRLSQGDGTLTLKIEDDGVGKPQSRPGHFGLATMRERANRIGAELSVESHPEVGTTIAAQISSLSGQAKGRGHVDHRAAS